MIYRTEGGEVYQPIDWRVYSREGNRVPLDSEEGLREYLKSHADEDFFLIPGLFMNREIQRVQAATFDPRGEHIRCGIVRYDSASGKVVTRDTMKVEYSDKAKQWGEGFALLQQATKRLEEVVGPATAWVVAVWDRAEDARGRSVYTLRISDWEGAVSATFTPDELRSRTQDRYYWHRLWGDLLQVRSHQQQLTSGGVRVGE